MGTRPKRKVVQDPKGRPGKDFMTEKSITVKNPRINKGKATNIPTVFKGRVRSEREAQKRIIQSGGVDPENPQRGKLKGFGSIKKAVKSAIKRSASLGKKRSKDILKARLKGKATVKSKRSRK